MTLLRVENLRTWFDSDRGPIRAVDGVDFELEAGRTLGVVGESGSGKSVTALSVMRLVDEPGHIGADSRIVFEDRDITQLAEKEMESLRGDEISMIFQEPMTSLNPVQRIGEQIAEAVRAHQGVSAADAAARAVEMLELVGIPEAPRRASDYPHQMSGGMRQRVMIAIALSNNPKLLIADEPTTALDVTIQAQILELMTDLRERLGMAMMLITHDLGVVAEMCDDVVVMYAGRVVESGPVADVFSSPQHPYTEALLQSIPMLGMTQAEPLRVIRGTVPSPLDWPEGCRFEPRCDYAFAKCREEHPPLFQVDRQQSACWLCENGRRTTAPVAAADAR
jgi:peptide/nickel transport system ATP-binding protein/oligopeptide transport system ATP-binding protein